MKMMLCSMAAVITLACEVLLCSSSLHCTLQKVSATLSLPMQVRRRGTAMRSCLLTAPSLMAAPPSCQRTVLCGRRLRCTVRAAHTGRTGRWRSRVRCLRWRRRAVRRLAAAEAQSNDGDVKTCHADMLLHFLSTGEIVNSSWLCKATGGA